MVNISRRRVFSTHEGTLHPSVYQKHSNQTHIEIQGFIEHEGYTKLKSKLSCQIKIVE